MVQEDLAISPCRLYESYFLLLILDVNFVKLQTKYTYNKRGSVTSSEKMAHKIGYSVYHSDIKITKTRKKDEGWGKKQLFDSRLSCHCCLDVEHEKAIIGQVCALNPMCAFKIGKCLLVNLIFLTL